MPRALLVLLALLGAAPTIGAAQAGSCELYRNEFTERRGDGGAAVIYIRGPLEVRCGGGAIIRADEGTLYEVSREMLLVGRVVFEDPERTLTSQQATYSSVTGRLYATGNVVLTDRSDGSTLRGPELEYYRVMPGRPEAQVMAGGRPHLIVNPRSQRPDGSEEPLRVDADRLTRIGEDRLFASGQVVIRRTDLDVTSAEAHLDRVAERLDLRGGARIVGEDYRLSGEEIDLLFPGDQMERILARRNAVLEGEDLRVNAPELQLYFADELLQRMVARGSASAGSANPRPSRPLAVAENFRIEGDSLEAILPAQRLERVTAVGNARAETLDTASVTAGGAVQLASEVIAAGGNLGDRDWISGDTVTGYFAARLPPDEGDAEAREVELERVVAHGSAQSLYRVTRENSPDGGQAGINYLVGDQIELRLENGELDLANVTGLKRGLYLDPTPPQAAPAEGTPPTNGAPAATGQRLPRSRR